MDRSSEAWLICRVGPCLCAVPARLARETMRPLPVTAWPEAPPFVRGLAIIRGAPVPVLDTATLLNAATTTTDAGAARLVTVMAGTQRVALAVDSVLGVRSLAAEAMQALPPLLGDAAVSARIGVLDARLLMVLEASRLLPDGLPVPPGAAEAAA